MMPMMRTNWTRSGIERAAARGGASGLSEEERQRQILGRGHSVGTGREW